MNTIVKTETNIEFTVETNATRLFRWNKTDEYIVNNISFLKTEGSDTAAVDKAGWAIHENFTEEWSTVGELSNNIYSPEIDADPSLNFTVPTDFPGQFIYEQAKKVFAQICGDIPHIMSKRWKLQREDKNLESYVVTFENDFQKFGDDTTRYANVIVFSIELNLTAGRYKIDMYNLSLGFDYDREDNTMKLLDMVLVNRDTNRFIISRSSNGR